MLDKSTDCVKIQLVKCCTTRQNNRWPKPEFLPARDVVQHGKLGLRPFCFPVSGRTLSKLMGQCQGRTHVLMPHMTPAARRFRATEENQQCKPTLRLAHETGAGQYESDVKRVAGHFGYTPTGWLSWAKDTMSGALGVILWPFKRIEAA